MSSSSMDDDHTRRLPHDVLAEVLRHVEAPPLLAASRCVCKTWRAVVDTYRLLRADLLPISLAGIFTHINHDSPPELFSLPHYYSSTSCNMATFDYYWGTDCDQHDPLMVVQHCNGLLLLQNMVDDRVVLNPATGQCARLPSPPPLCLLGTDEFENWFLVFDPIVSTHYQVFLINSVRYDCGDPVLDPSTDMAQEWPPSLYTVRVFSSKTRLWKKKRFSQQGEAAGTVLTLLRIARPRYHYAAYWRGALYVHQCDYLMRITLSDDTYQVILLPEGLDLEDGRTDDVYLGKSKDGVYCALFNGYGGFGLQLWFLDETGGQMKWSLRQFIDVRPLLGNFRSTYDDGPSTIDCANHDEDVTGTEDMTAQSYTRYDISLLGFHPNKETIFFHTPSRRVMAYNFNNSEIEDLGYLPTKGARGSIYMSFPYTPCRVGELSSDK